MRTKRTKSSMGSDWLQRRGLEAPRAARGIRDLGEASSADDAPGRIILSIIRKVSTRAYRSPLRLFSKTGSWRPLAATRTLKIN